MIGPLMVGKGEINQKGNSVLKRTGSVVSGSFKKVVKNSGGCARGKGGITVLGMVASGSSLTTKGVNQWDGNLNGRFAMTEAEDR